MAASSDLDLLVLQGLRLRSFASSAVVAEAAGLPVDVVAERLERFAEKGWVRHRDGARPGWALLPAGRAEGERMLGDELDARGLRAQVQAAHRSFLALNQRLLRLCTDWQVRGADSGDPVVNDHTDPAYDQRVIAALRAFDAEAQPVAQSLAAALERFGTYPERLALAVEKTAAGEWDWFDRPTVDSYHTIWFELHENLLSTLGIERGTEEPV